MGCESYLGKVIRCVSVVSLFVYLHVKWSTFQFSFTDFSLVYRSAFAQIFPRSQPMTKSTTSIVIPSDYVHVQQFLIFTINIETKTNLEEHPKCKLKNLPSTKTNKCSHGLSFVFFLAGTISV
jgi:hypothetical protein